MSRVEEPWRPLPVEDIEYEPTEVGEADREMVAEAGRVADDALGGLYDSCGPPSKGHLEVCAIYSKTTVN